MSNLAARFEPIGDAEFEDLLAQIDKDKLDRSLFHPITGLLLDARTAALDLNVRASRVATAHEPAWEDRHFDELAGTGGADGWTARFEVDTEIPKSALWNISVSALPCCRSRVQDSRESKNRIPRSSDELGRRCQ